MILGNCGGLLLLALGTVATTIGTPEASPQLKDKFETIPKLEDPQFFFISKVTGLWQAVKDEKGNLKAERRTYHSSTERAIAMDFHYDKNRLFWSTYDGGIYSCPMRGRNVLSEDVKLIYSYSDWYPVSIAVDYISDLLYIIDSKTNTLSVMSLDGSTGTNMIRSFDPVVGEDFEPRYLEVDPYEGLIFFMDSYNAINHIYRMNSDGSNPQPLDNQSFQRQRRIGYFTLDRENQRLLVSSPFDKAIVSVNYMGEDIRAVLRANNYASSMTIDEENSYLYFVNITAYAMYSMQEKVTDIMKTHLYRCNYGINTNQKCAPGSLELINGTEWSAILQLKAVRAPTRRPEQNHCDRRPCEHICIYTATRSEYRCRCKSGYRLASGGRCLPIEEFLIFENDNYVGGIDMTAPEPGLDRANDEVFAPFKIKMRPIGDDQFGFDYDPLRERLLYSNNHEVNAKFLKRADKYTTLINPERNYGLLAIDSASNQFYFVERSKTSQYSTEKYSIGVSTILEPAISNHVDTLIQRTAVKLLKINVGLVRSLAVYPALGYVFYVSYNENSGQFELTRMMVDGSNATSLSDVADVGAVSYMALDYDEEKIYYIDDHYCLHRADFNGQNVERIIRLPRKGDAPISCINGFSVYGDWIYIKDSNDIRRYNKKMSLCKQWEVYDPKPYNFDMRTQLRFHSTKTNATKPTPCSSKNIHGCQQLCFALPNAEGKLQAQCACDDRFELESDKKSCK